MLFETSTRSSFAKGVTVRRMLGGLAAALVASLMLSTLPASANTAAVGRAVSTDLTVASFNVLGSSHTRGHARFASGVSRTDGVVELVRRHDVEVVGFQEMQADQLRAFLDKTSGQYDVYPGFSMRRRDTENSLAWDRTAWEAIEKRTVDIPYFNGNLRPMPVVKLRNLATGMTAWLVNVHNPATNRKHPGQDGWRRKAIRREVALMRRLSETGIPVFLTGDMNEREEAFCPITGGAPMKAARGGTHENGVCRAENPTSVDWIFGHRDVGFSGYVEDRSRLVRRTSDHAMIVTEAHLDPFAYPDAIALP
jgi:hypothetical protein